MSSNLPLRLIADESGTLAGRATMADAAGSIAHEVNETLAAMVTNAECCLLWLGKERPDLERARKAAERIVRNGHDASDVVRSIRARLRNGK
ncbi:MAG TPA: hypothetical protein VGO53_14055 [Steroidobacteraceae bacterium]|nr:hypothetical protein [Steroidobacteraceae bacterium]